MAKVASSTVDDLLRRADALSQSGRVRESWAVLRDAVAMAPRNAFALAAFGWITAELGDTPKGAELLRKAVSIDGTKAKYHYWLGTVLQRLPDVAGAELSFKRAIALKPDMPDSYGGLSSIYERTSRRDEAIEVLAKGCKAIPRDAQLHALYWSMRSEAGDREAARDGLRAVLAWEPAPPPEAVMRASYALGLTLDKLGDYDGAFEAFERASRIRLTQGPVQEALRRDDFTELVSEQKRITREMLQRWTAQEPDDGLPVPAMLIGFPRSGTTMTENVLGQHPRVQATPECPMLPKVIQEVQKVASSSGRTLLDVLDGLSATELTRLRRMYWELAQEETDGAFGPDYNAKMIMDKFPLHIARVGVINRLFPRAKLIVALRDPRDCCLSAHTQLFGVNSAMVRFLTLEGTARMYELVMGLYVEMRDRLTCPVLQIRYEDTVVDLEAQCRRMLGFLGLEWDDRVTRPEERARKLYTGTPSYREVTGKVNTRAKGRWLKYRRHLEPIFPILEPFIQEFGYERSDSVPMQAGEGSGT